MLKKIVLAASALTLLIACIQENNGENTPEVSAVTIGAEEITEVSAVLKGKAVLESSAASGLKAGFQYSSSADILPSNSITVEASDVDANYNYSAKVTGLEPHTTYYFRSMVRQYNVDAYGETMSFTTGEEGGPSGPVDLGLPSGLKWATCNIGASKPEEYGDYYAWGETETKSKYDWSTYKWCNGSVYNTYKYNTSSSYGTVDNRTMLESSDDVAHVKLGDKWRMPTDEEWTELRTKCSWTWTTQNGVYGRKITGPNGNSIFLPAAGDRGGTSLNGAGSYGYYWSSSLDTDNPYCAWCVLFDFWNVYRDNLHRYFGMSVRPVYGDVVFVPVTGVSLNTTSLSLTEGGDTYTLTVTVSPSNATDKSVTWSSSNTSVATVSSSGVVTAKKAGNATITVKTNNGGKTATCAVMVKGASGQQAVDLGLPSGLKWGSCNIGASKPEEYGDYYAWGETETKSKYDWSTYKWCNGSYNPLTKYNTLSYFGTVDNKTKLENSDDVARVKLGGKWRMPTDAEWTELRTKCSWTWTTQNGVAGRKVTGPNGKSIFLPAAGGQNGTSLSYAGSGGLYWSSSLYTVGPVAAWFVVFGSEAVDRRYVNRFYGFSVRPVSE